MRIKPKISIRGFARNALLALRTKLNIRPKFTMPEVARESGLQVEYLDDVSTDFDGYLDLGIDDVPRFIVVNQNLPPEIQVFTIARELGYCAQQRRCNSFALDRPWKWKLLEGAPEEYRQKICLLDAEHRAHRLMAWFATGDQFRAFVKNNPKKWFVGLFATNMIGFHLYSLRIRTWIYKVFVALALS